MNSIQKRFVMFLLLCIPTRAFFAYTAKTTNLKTLKNMGFLALLPAIGFMYIYLTKSRQTGLETQGAKIWWNDWRPIYSLIYFSFAYMAINGMKEDAYKALALDVFIGLTTFLVHHYEEGNFSKLFN
jgi:hypothetical protein